MKSFLISLSIFVLTLTHSQAQVFKVDSIKYVGDENKYINIVIMGDGYTANEQDKFITDAKKLSDYLFLQSPWSDYVNYFNIFGIRVISNQSGITHPNTAPDCYRANPKVPTTSVDTYFGVTFDSYNIHRLPKINKVFNVSSVLMYNTPYYDLVLIISNTPYYGGAGGNYAVATVNSASNEVVAHELGHSFANLADEYYAGDIYFMEKPNMTQESNANLVKWKNWINTNNVGMYQYCCSGNSNLWYKPSTGCKMEVLNLPYCSVCSETIVEKIHSLVNPIISYSPSNTSTINSVDQFISFKLNELAKPINNTLSIQWSVDGSKVLKNIDSLKINQNILSSGTHKITATVIDTTNLVRTDNHASIHLNTVSWTLNKTITNTEITSTTNRIKYAIYPNPTSATVSVEVNSEDKEQLSINLNTSDGKFIQTIGNNITVQGNHNINIPIEHLAAGTYTLVFQLGNTVQSINFIKQ